MKPFELFLPKSSCGAITEQKILTNVLVMSKERVQKSTASTRAHTQKKSSPYLETRPWTNSYQQKNSSSPSTAKPRSTAEWVKDNVFQRVMESETEAIQTDASFEATQSPSLQHNLEDTPAPTLQNKSTAVVASEQVQLQGNATQQVEQTPLVQTKLRIGQPGDKCEVEADSMAAKVMAMPDSAVEQPIQRASYGQHQAVQASQLVNSITPEVQRAHLQAASVQLAPLVQSHVGDTQASESFSNRLASTKGRGSPLPEDVRAFMEARFGADFSAVRVHTDANAVVLNQELRAQAFAHGSDIYYGQGKSPNKDELTAHELTHVIQQGGATPINKVNPPPQKLKQLPTLVAKQYKADPDSLRPNQQQQQMPSAKPLQAKQLTTHTTSTSFNKELHHPSNPQQKKPTLQPKHYSSLSLSSVTPQIQGNWLGQGIEEGKRVFKEKLAQHLKKLPSYQLLVLIIGSDPITNTPVERNATKVVSAVLSLVPGGNDLLKKLQESKSTEQAFQWLKEQFATLNLTHSSIKALFSQALSRLGPGDLFNLDSAVEKIKQVFTPAIEGVRNFAVALSKKVMEFAFVGLMKDAGGQTAKVMAILRKAGGAYGAIIANPVGFLQNLVRALRGGFEKFSQNFGQHFQKGLTNWLFGTLGGDGLVMPAKFDLPGFFSIVLQVLRLTYKSVRPKLVKAVGSEAAVAKAERRMDILQKIANGGFSSAWQQLASFLENPQKMLAQTLNSILEMVVQKIISEGVRVLISLFSPAGVLLQAVIRIYNAIVFFIEESKRIAALANAVFDSLTHIANGKVEQAASHIEQVMGRTLGLAISFLARQAGFGNIRQAIVKIIKKLQQRVEPAIERLMDSIANKAKILLAGERDPNTQQRQTNTRSHASTSSVTTSYKPTISVSNHHKISSNNVGKTDRNSTQIDQSNVTNTMGEFRVEYPFSMSAEPHHLIAKYQNRQLTLLMATGDPLLLIPTLLEAIEEVEKTPSASFSYPEAKKECLVVLNNALKQAQNVEYDVERDLNKITAEYKTGNNSERIVAAKKEETKARLASIANQLERTGQLTGVTDLDRIKVLKNYYTQPPKERYLPIPSGETPSEFIRKHLYSQWKTVRDAFYNREQPKLIQKIKKVQAMPKGITRNNAWSQLIAVGLVERKYTGEIDKYNSTSIDYHVDHIQSLALLWNKSGQMKNNIAGRDSDDAERYNHMSEPSNLEVVTAEYNTSKGSGGVNFEIHVGPNFISKDAENGKKGALRFKGVPFLDAKNGNPLI